MEEAIRRALREIEDNRILTDREKAELAATFMEMIQSDVAVRRQQFATILRATMRASGTGQ